MLRPRFEELTINQSNTTTILWFQNLQTATLNTLFSYQLLTDVNVPNEWPPVEQSELHLDVWPEVQQGQFCEHATRKFGQLITSPTSRHKQEEKRSEYQPLAQDNVRREPHNGNR